MNNLLTENVSIEINYSKYFDECAPLNCTYTKTSQTNFLNAITLLVSLYGGLTIILRLIAPLFISLSFKFQHRSQNSNVNPGIFLISTKHIPCEYNFYFLF